jgi:hypothetical protein
LADHLGKHHCVVDDLLARLHGLDEPLSANALGQTTARWSRSMTMSPPLGCRASCV